MADSKMLPVVKSKHPDQQKRIYQMQRHAEVETQSIALEKFQLGWSQCVS